MLIIKGWLFLVAVQWAGLDHANVQLCAEVSEPMRRSSVLSLRGCIDDGISIRDAA